MIRERKGFVTATKVDTLDLTKQKLARKEMTQWSDKFVSMVPVPNEYENPKDPEFRKLKEIEPGMVDFALQIRP